MGVPITDILIFEEIDLDINAKFDIENTQTRLYPISGGLAQSCGAKEILSEDEIRVVSGWQNCVKALEEFENNKQIRLLDILFCDGGCINGPGIESKLNLEERRKKIINFRYSNS